MTTIQTAIDRYVRERHKLGRITRTTARDVKYTLQSVADHVGPQMAVGRLGPRHIETWLMSRTYSDNTKATNLGRVRSFTKWCVAQRLLKADPCAAIDTPKRAQTVPRNLHADAVNATLEVCDPRLAVAVLLGAQEGLRRAEICATSTSDIDHHERLLRVHGKGRKERWVPISDETWSAIQRYLLEHPAGPGRPLIRSYVDPTQGLAPKTLGGLIVRAMREAGVKLAARDGRSAHSLRHTCAQDMLDRGADLRSVSEMLGHSGMSVTGQVYARRMVAVGNLREAAAGRVYRESLR